MFDNDYPMPIAFTAFLAGLQNGSISQTISVSSALKLSLLSTNSTPDPILGSEERKRNTAFFFPPKDTFKILENYSKKYFKNFKDTYFCYLNNSVSRKLSEYYF